jgi:hypothetical protein
MYPTEIEKYIINSFKELVFNEKAHTYRIGDVKLPSVSSIIQGLTVPFDKEKILPASARLQNIPVHELDWQWREKNRIACELGHKTHDFLEHYTGLETPTSKQEQAGIDYIRSLAGKYRISFRELRAFSRKYLYAGTMDLPLEVIEGNSYEIADYKTNNTDLFKAYSLLKSPFNYLEASAYNKYQIQLTLYQMMLEEIGLRISNRRLVHLMSDGTHKVYDLLDFTDEMKPYLEYKLRKAA